MCVSQSSGTGGSRRPCLAAPRAKPNPGPVVGRPALAALDSVFVRAARAGPGGELQSCPPPALSPAGSLARLLCLSALAQPRGAGWGAGEGAGRGGSCILAVGEESEPALLVSRRAQLQPRGPARPLAAGPGLLGWARARPRAGGGAGLPSPAPNTLGVSGAGCSAWGGGVGCEGFPTRGEGRAWERESPREPGQTSWPPHMGTFATYPFSAFCLCGPGVGMGAC